jgi:hypothetical protein
MDAFGASGVAHRLEGGQGQSFAAGDIVLKPAPDEESASWSADVLSSVVEDGFRVARPVRSSAGGWVTDGWCAHTLVAGEHRTWDGPWPEALAACQRFHRALEGMPPPPFLRRRHDIFAIADRVVWGERSVEVDEPIAWALRELAGAHPAGRFAAAAHPWRRRRQPPLRTRPGSRRHRLLAVLAPGGSRRRPDDRRRNPLVRSRRQPGRGRPRRR